jgi:hypothetical protein
VGQSLKIVSADYGLHDSRRPVRQAHLLKIAPHNRVQAIEFASTLQLPLAAHGAPYISVVIATYQRRARLVECLERLASCEGAKVAEVIVVEQSAPEPKSEIAGRFGASFHRLEYIELPAPNVSAARNLTLLPPKRVILSFRVYVTNLHFRCFGAIQSGGVYAKRCIEKP